MRNSFIYSLYDGSSGTPEPDWVLLIDPNDATVNGSNQVTAWTDALSGLEGTVQGTLTRELDATIGDYVINNFSEAGRIYFPNIPLTDFSVYIVMDFDVIRSRTIFSTSFTTSGEEAEGFSIISDNDNGGELQLVIKDGVAPRRYIKNISSVTGYNIISIKYKRRTDGNSYISVSVDGDKSLISSLGSLMVESNNITYAFGDNSASESDAKFAFIGLSDSFHTQSVERSVIEMLNNRFGLSADLNTYELYFDDAGSIDLSTSADEYNGLDYFTEGGKINFIASMFNANEKVIVLEQGATEDDWTETELFDRGEEYQSLKIWRYDTGEDPAVILITASKDGNAIDLHYASTLKGSYTTVELKGSINKPQDIKIYDIDGDGVDEIVYTWQGTSGAGGINVLDFDGSDPTDPADWTDYALLASPMECWWIAGVDLDVLNDGNSDKILFSCRNNEGGSTAGIYYITKPIGGALSGTWTVSTITNEDADWLHVDFGNFLGNPNDILAHRLTSTDGLSFFDGSDSFTETNFNPLGAFSATIYNAKGLRRFGTSIGMPVIFNISTNARYAVWWNGSEFVGTTLKVVAGNHPFDNEVYELDVNNNGSYDVFVDDSTQTNAGDVKRFRLDRNEP